MAQKLAAKPNYDRCTIFDKNLIAVHMKKSKLYLSKPVYLGMIILDLSKSLMYDFHYNNIFNTRYGNKAKLLGMWSGSDDRDDDDSTTDDAGDGDGEEGEGKDDNDISDDTGSVRVDDIIIALAWLPWP